MLPRPDDIKLIVHVPHPVLCTPAAEGDPLRTDVDGTLLTSEHRCHPRTIRAIRSLRKTRPELPIVICSGKQYISTLHLRQPDILDLDDDCPALHCHGSAVHGPQGRLLSMVTLSSDAVKTVVEAFNNVATFLFTEDDVLLIQDDGEHDWLTLARKYDKKVSDHRAPADRLAIMQKVAAGELLIVKVTLAVSIEQAEDLMGDLVKLKERMPSADGFSVSRAIPQIIEVGPRGVDKGTALRELCEMLGISTSQVLAFGDGENDEPLLQTAGFGVVMANGMDRAKAVARYETLSNDEGGVGAFLERVYGVTT